MEADGQEVEVKLEKDFNKSAVTQRKKSSNPFTGGLVTEGIPGLRSGARSGRNTTQGYTETRSANKSQQRYPLRSRQSVGKEHQTSFVVKGNREAAVNQ